jgi:hypothetical protein
MEIGIRTSAAKPFGLTSGLPIRRSPELRGGAKFAEFDRPMTDRTALIAEFLWEHGLQRLEDTFAALKEMWPDMTPEEFSAALAVHTRRKLDANVA